MKKGNMIQNVIIVFSLFQFSNFAYATQIITLQIDSSKSWVQDQSWVETTPNSNEAIYHKGGVFSLGGSVNVVYSPYSIEINGVNVSPDNLPSGREVTLDIDTQILKDNVFPNNSFSLPEGTICACTTNFIASSPSISGIFEDMFLSVDYSENGLYIFPGNVTWIGELPSDSTRNQYSFHIEASVVPVPPAFVLLLSALGFLGLPKIYFQREKRLF